MFWPGAEKNSVMACAVNSNSDSDGSGKGTTSPKTQSQILAPYWYFCKPEAGDARVSCPRINVH